MAMKFAALAVAALGLAGAAHAAPVAQTVYDGKVGNSPVVLEIVRAPGGKLAAGRYFYRKVRVDIPLRVTARAGKTVLQELPSDCLWDMDACKATAEFSLSADGAGLSGTWSKPGGKPVAVTLTQMGAHTPDLAEPAENASGLLTGIDAQATVANDSYLRARLDGPVTLGPETRTNGVAYQTVTDSGTGIHFIRLTAAPNAAAMVKVNALLDARRLEMVGWGLECRGEGKDNPSAGTLGGWDEYESKVTYTNGNILVIQEGGSTYCGGAYPNNSFNYSTYDLRQGALLDINTVLALYDEAEFSEGGSETTYTPAYQALQAKLTPKSPWYVGGEMIEECLSEDLGYDYSVTFNATGAVFALVDLPHVMGACMGDYYVVPYAELKGLWTPQAKAYFPQAK